MAPSLARQARAARAKAIRRRLIAGSLSLFIAAWLLIAVVLVSGHDPALAARKPSVAAVVSTPTTTTATPTTTTATPTTTTATPTTTTAAAPAGSSVTTRQS